LNEVFKGGLSSYSLVLMVVHFFHSHSGAKEETNLGRLLLQFLELYGLKLNYEEVGLRVRDGTYVSKAELLKTMEIPNGETIGYNNYKPSLLCIEDPLNACNNVSRNSYAVHKVRDAFAYAFHRLYTAVGPNRAVVDTNDSLLGRIIRVTDAVVDQRNTRSLHYNPYQRTKCGPNCKQGNWRRPRQYSNYSNNSSSGNSSNTDSNGTERANYGNREHGYHNHYNHNYHNHWNNGYNNGYNKRNKYNNNNYNNGANYDHQGRRNYYSFNNNNHRYNRIDNQGIQQ